MWLRAELGMFDCIMSIVEWNPSGVVVGSFYCVSPEQVRLYTRSKQLNWFRRPDSVCQGKREENVDYVLCENKRGEASTEQNVPVWCGGQVEQEWGLCSVSCRKLVRLEGRTPGGRGGTAKY